MFLGEDLEILPARKIAFLSAGEYSNVSGVKRRAVATGRNPVCGGRKE
jgi:hypothetical protein